MRPKRATIAFLAAALIIVLAFLVFIPGGGRTAGAAQAAPEGVPVWMVVALVVVLVAAILYEAYLLERRRLGLVEDIFLIHRDGRMIKHYSRRVKPIDAEIFASMLSAVQAFVKDSMRSGGVKLEELKFGDSRILIEHGEHVFLAVVYVGKRPARLRAAMRDCVRGVEGGGPEVFAKWDGSTVTLPPVVNPQLARLASRTY